MSQREGVGKVRVNRTGNVRDDNGRGDFSKNKGGSRRWGALFNRPCGLLLLVLFVLASACPSKGSSMTSSPSSPTSSLRVLVPLMLLLLLRLLLLLLEGWGGCQGGPRRSPEIQSTLVWSSCWGATGSAGRSTQRGEQRKVVRARGNKGEVGVTRDQCRVW